MSIVDIYGGPDGEKRRARDGAIIQAAAAGEEITDKPLRRVQEARGVVTRRDGFGTGSKVYWSRPTSIEAPRRPYRPSTRRGQPRRWRATMSDEPTLFPLDDVPRDDRSPEASRLARYHELHGGPPSDQTAPFPPQRRQYQILSAAVRRADAERQRLTEYRRLMGRYPRHPDQDI
jgi:hypothetical protein